jgi:hypothetical protein
MTIGTGCARTIRPYLMPCQKSEPTKAVQNLPGIRYGGFAPYLLVVPVTDLRKGGDFLEREQNESKSTA